MPLAAFVLNLLAFFASLLEMPRALRWWQDQRSLDLKQQARQIREGLLQELFAVRRSIEASPAAAKPPDDWLTQIEHIYRQLEQIGHHLSPSYLEESLPFAVQYALQAWRRQYPTVELAIDLPTAWADATQHRTGMVLTTLDRLLQLAVSNGAPKSIQIGLTAQPQGGLTVQVHYADAIAADCCNAKEMRYLEQCFRVLMPGSCLHRRNGPIVTWYFYWRLH